MATTSVGIHMTAQEHAALIDLAERFGCVSKRGPGAEEPSIRALLADIASGVLVLKRARPGKPRATHRTASSKVREALAADPALGPTDLARIGGCSVGMASKVKKEWLRARGAQPAG